jgi:hypothetical protein
VSKQDQSESEPVRPVLNIKDTNLGVSLSFRAPAHWKPGKVGLLLRDEVPIIRRFLDDPVNWPVVGRKPDARRNGLLALLLSIDRVHGDQFALTPLDRVCDRKRHVKGYSGPPCALCVVLRVLGRMHGEKLIAITKVIGEIDDKGRYLHAEKIHVEPGENFEGYRQKIMRLPLPALLDTTPGDKPAAKSVLARLATLPVETWSQINMSVSPDGFKVGAVEGYPSDLGLAQHEWAVLCDIAKAKGNYAPKLLGSAATKLRMTVDALNAAVKSAFPQLTGEAIRRTATGGLQTAFSIKGGSKGLDAVW